MQIYIDGDFYSEADAKISVFDHGLLYGDGVFEGIRVYDGRVFELDAHVDRLFSEKIAADQGDHVGVAALAVAIPLLSPHDHRNGEHQRRQECCGVKAKQGAGQVGHP